MPYTFLLFSSEESVRRGSFFNKTARFTPFSVTTERSRCQACQGLANKNCLSIVDYAHNKLQLSDVEGSNAHQMGDSYFKQAVETC